MYNRKIISCRNERKIYHNPCCMYVKRMLSENAMDISKAEAEKHESLYRDTGHGTETEGWDAVCENGDQLLEACVFETVAEFCAVSQESDGQAAGFQTSGSRAVSQADRRRNEY